MPSAPLVDVKVESESAVVFPKMIDHYIRTGVSDLQLEKELRGKVE